jgi:hypothetical protein
MSHVIDNAIAVEPYFNFYFDNNNHEPRIGAQSEMNVTSDCWIHIDLNDITNTIRSYRHDDTTITDNHNDDEVSSRSSYGTIKISN